MRKLLLLPLFMTVLLLSSRAQVGGQDYVSDIRSIDPADTDYSDFAGLKKAIGDARIVLLGEQTHGEGSTFLAKTRMIKFLHEQAGFEVLAFESGFYDCARIWQNVRGGGQLSEEVIGSLFYMYATSKQMTSLFDYVQTGLPGGRGLVIAGFESQHSGVKAKTELFGDFERFLRREHPTLIDSTWRLFGRISVTTFGSLDYRPGEEERRRFFQEVGVLKQALAGNPVAIPAEGRRRDQGAVAVAEGRGADQETAPKGLDSLTGSAGFWYQVVCSIESQALRYWQLVKGNEVSVRDRQMAENLIWLAEKAYPGKKIIVWAHNAHIAKSLTSLGPADQARATATGPAGKGKTEPATAASGQNAGASATDQSAAPAADDPNAFVPMGVTIHRYFGARAYHIGFSGAGGSYMDYTDSKIIPVIPKLSGHIEGMVTTTGHPYVFIDYHHAPASYRQKQVASLADYGDLSGLWPEVFDGLFVIKEIFPVERTGR